jgi:acetyltransferase-like isoleucine patch superfamily enzyme
VTRPDAHALREQHKQRMAHMPHLYFEAGPEIRAWAEPWQAELHARLRALEDVEVDPSAFVAPGARLFAEPHRPIRIGPRAAVAADAFLHGPVELGAEVSVNPFAVLDGGRRGITLGAGTRVASHACIYAFDHGLAPDAPVRAQPVRSLGVRVEQDVWIGAHAVITDGVTLGERCVVGAGAVVTRDVPAWAIVGGVPARVLGDRRRR